MPPNSKETELESSNQEASPSAGKNIKIVLVPCCTWKCVLATTSGGVNICKVLWRCLLQQMNSRWKSWKLLQGLVSYKLTAYLFVLNLFLTQWIMTILSKECKPDTFESYNSLALQIFEAFLSISLNVNLSLNQTLLTLVLYVWQTCMIKLILAIFLWGVVFLKSKRILLLICVV